MPTRLAQLYQSIQSALPAFARTYQDLQQGAAWLRALAYRLEPVNSQVFKGQQVAEQLRASLDAIRYPSEVSPAIGCNRRY